MIPIYQGVAAIQALQQLEVSFMNVDPALAKTVQGILEAVRTEGDVALRRFAQQFGDPLPTAFALPEAEIEAAVGRVPKETRQLLQRAAQNIQAFADAVMQSVQAFTLQQDGFQVGLDWRPAERVACYVPGGRYPLPSTALMTSVTAQTAGVPSIAIVSPDLRDETIYAGTLAGVRAFYRLGGAQAVAAMAYGTASIPRMDMVVGPGNTYVTEAKRQLQGVIGIDMLAGPSEVAIIADAQANPDFVALDLLAQAEHDANARAYLFTDSPVLAEQTVSALVAFLARHPGLPAHLRETSQWGAAFVLPSLADCVEAVNAIAPEHLELLVADPLPLKASLKHYGALFMGYHTPVPIGDYMAGPNHTLPTGRSARFSGALNPLTFLRPQGWIQTSPNAEALVADVVRFARLEGLTAHALSAESRIGAAPG
jgi:histidinol dehydrogenase